MNEPVRKKKRGRPSGKAMVKAYPEEFKATPAEERREILEKKPFWQTYSRAEAIEEAKKVLGKYGWKFPKAWLVTGLSERPPVWFTMGEMERARTRGGKSILRPVVRFFEEDIIRYYIENPPHKRGMSRVPNNRILFPKGI